MIFFLLHCFGEYIILFAEVIVLLYYRVVHLFFTKQAKHVHFFNIGIYDTRKRAEEVIFALRGMNGFRLHPEKFYTIRALRFRKPKLLNQTYWADGFTSVTYK